MIVRHRVANFETWKQVFEEMEGARKAHGWIGYELHRDAADPNVVTIVNHMKDLAGAKAYGASPELRAAMAKGGIQGPPELFFLDDVEARRY
jgi:quinol monooxygenase YgiN